MPFCRFARMIVFLFCGVSALVCLGQGPSNGNRIASDVTVPTVHGIFIPSIPNAPFSATLQVVSRQKLSDGSTYVLKLINHIARDSRGRTYGERRQFYAESVEGESLLLGFAIYDPVTGLDTNLDPYTLIARQTIVKAQPAAAPETVPVKVSNATPPVTREDLGTKTLEGLTVHGTREAQGDSVNDFWYATDLSLYILRKHVDPRWEQTFTVTNIDRAEPETSRFVVPGNYTIADRTQSPDQDGVYRVGGGVSPPRMIHSVDPEYSDQARRENVTGICVLGLVVDRAGVPQNVHVIRSLGKGLDEKAVEAVSQYRFSPAVYQGKPVPVVVNIEVNFQIYDSPKSSSPGLAPLTH